MASRCLAVVDIEAELITLANEQDDTRALRRVGRAHDE
jgi:hypothetical protein